MILHHYNARIHTELSETFQIIEITAKLTFRNFQKLLMLSGLSAWLKIPKSCQNTLEDFTNLKFRKLKISTEADRTFVR